MPTVERRILSEQVAEKIKDYIVDHSLRPGDRLPTEFQLAERFGVSRVSIREATKALGFLGIIRAAPRRGLTVGEVKMSRLTRYLGFHLAVHDYPKENLLQSRMVIEIGALPYAMRRITADPQLRDSVLEAAESSVASVPTANADEEALQRFIDSDVVFHRRLVEASGLEPLVAFSDLLRIFFIRFHQSVLDARETWSVGAKDHRRIVQALIEGNLQLAQGVLTQHLEYHRGHL